MGQTTEAHLLEQYRETGSDAAFESLVQQHGPMVLATCRRILRNGHDAEDAFQATFLILARKASLVRSGQSLGAWLHRVASRVALELKQRNAVQERRERQAAQMRQELLDQDESWNFIGPVLDDELERLPAKYRLPIILCHLEGKSRDEAAAELGLNLNQFKGRLQRGIEALRSRLCRRGIVVAAPALALLLAEKTASAALPAALAKTTVLAGSAVIAGSAIPSGMISAKAMLLADAVRRGLLIPAMKLLLLAGLGASAITATVVHMRPSSAPPVRIQPKAPRWQPASIEVINYRPAPLLSDGQTGAEKPLFGWRRTPQFLQDAIVYSVRPNPQIPISPLDGLVEFKTKSEGIVLLACNWDYEGNNEGGWIETRWTKEQFLADGWQPQTIMLSDQNRVWTVLAKQVHAGESYRLRCNKNTPPMVIVPTPEGLAAMTEAAKQVGIRPTGLMATTQVPGPEAQTGVRLADIVNLEPTQLIERADLPSDPPNYINWRTVPPFLRGATIYSLDVGSNGATDFVVQQGGIVYLACDFNVNLAAGAWTEEKMSREEFQIQGWEEVGEMVATNGTAFVVFKKRVEAGQWYRLRSTKRTAPYLMIRPE